MMEKIDFMLMSASNIKEQLDKNIEATVAAIRTIAVERPESIADSMGVYLDKLRKQLTERKCYEEQLEMLKCLKEG
jgi:hypothetical protein